MEWIKEGDQVRVRMFGKTGAIIPTKDENKLYKVYDGGAFIGLGICYGAGNSFMPFSAFSSSVYFHVEGGKGAYYHDTISNELKRAY